MEDKKKPVTILEAHLEKDKRQFQYKLVKLIVTTLSNLIIWISFFYTIIMIVKNLAGQETQAKISLYLFLSKSICKALFTYSFFSTICSIILYILLSNRIKALGKIRALLELRDDIDRTSSNLTVTGLTNEEDKE